MVESSSTSSPSVSASEARRPHGKATRHNKSLPGPGRRRHRPGRARIVFGRLASPVSDSSPASVSSAAAAVSARFIGGFDLIERYLNRLDFFREGDDGGGVLVRRGVGLDLLPQLPGDIVDDRRGADGSGTLMVGREGRGAVTGAFRTAAGAGPRSFASGPSLP